MPAPYTLSDFLADQLKAVAPGAEWNAAGVDRAHELAEVLKRSNISDLTKLRLVPAVWKYRPYLTAPIEEIDGFAFEYDGRKFGYLGDADGKDFHALPILKDTNLASWSSAGHGNVSYRVVRNSRGFAIVPMWGSSSDAANIRDFVMTAGALGVGVVMPVAGVNVGAMIGGAVVPASFAASYPLVTAAIGNAALGAAFNGGDISAAAKMAALGSIGTAAGSYAGAAALNVSDLEIMGKLADSATRAVLTGRDLDKAVALTLLQNAGAAYDAVTGPPEMAPLPIPEITIEDSQMDYIGDDSFYTPDQSAFDWQMAPLEIPDVIFEAQSSVFDPISLSEPLPQFQQLAFEELQVPAFPDLPALPEFAALQNVVIETPMPPKSDPFTLADTRNLINTVSSAALAAISVVAAVKNLNRDPTVNTTARYVDPRTGAATVALDTGVIQTRDAAGNVTTSRPPTGQPQSTATGNVVINNGDGTYSLISPSGQTRVIRYDPQNSGGFAIGGVNLADIPIPAILGGVGVLALLLRKR